MDQLLNVSGRLYRQLLKLYPDQFQRRFSAEMDQTFRDCCKDTYEQHGFLGLICLWATVPQDFIVNVFAEYRALHTKGNQLMGELSLSLIVPVFNEEATLKAVIDEALQELPKRFDSYEVIVVNDGSTDQTAQVANALAGEHPQVVRTIHRKSNQGYKLALEAGFHEAKGSYVMVLHPNTGFGAGNLKTQSAT